VLVTFGQIAQPQVQPNDEASLRRLSRRGTVSIKTQFRAAVPANDFADFLKSVIKVARVYGLDLSDEEATNAGNDS